ncbi:3-coathanger stack domain-containing protein [uncultured Arcticibacterium sp.]|uniref:3-coathanger stack domain-containing protein n=1 Tax=uncultured Arcticibacterium sp. TaxID=2173042 RepID=UPI0030F76E89
MKVVGLSLLFCNFFISLFGQTILKDIVTSNSSSYPGQPIELNGSILFNTQNLPYLSQGGLYTSNGTLESTNLVKGKNLPQRSSNFSFLLQYAENFGDNIIFIGNEYDYGNEPWISNGSPDGTHRIIDLIPGRANSISLFLKNNTLRAFHISGNKAYFVAQTENSGKELFVTDGSETGTILLKDINPGIANSYPANFTNWQGKTYFSAQSANGTELWVTDGTATGTILVSDIYSGQSSSSPENLIGSSSNLFFSAISDLGRELWKTDGTQEGTVLIKDISYGSKSSYFKDLAILNDNLIINASGDIWIYQESTGTTDRVYIRPGENASPSNFIKTNNQLFFTANDGVHGQELWKTDGTKIGTNLVVDLNKTGSAFVNQLNEISIYASQDTILFIADDGIHGNELWKSDGTTLGTEIVKDFGEGSKDGIYRYITDSGLGPYFVAGDTLDNCKLYYYNSNIGKLTSINDLPSNAPFSNAYPFYGTSNKMFFVAYHDEFGYELFVSDGTQVSFLGDLVKEEFGSPSIFFPILSTGNSEGFFFTFPDNEHGNALWKTNGNEESTNLFFDTNSYPAEKINDVFSFHSANSEISDLITYKDQIFLLNRYGTWKSNGIVPFKNISPSKTFTDIRKFCISNETLFWNDGATLWSYNGSEPPREIKKLNTIILDLFDANGKLFFTSYQNSLIGLWQSDGTEAGTHLVRSGIHAEEHAALGDKLFFSAEEQNSGKELWISDGTQIGTFMIKDINPNEYAGSIPRDIRKINDSTVIFLANDGVTGYALWKTNGTSEKTEMLIDLSDQTGYTGDFIFDEPLQGYYYIFSRATNINNSKLWKTDGTSHGTSVFYSGLIVNDFNIVINDSIIYFPASLSSQEDLDLWQTDGTNDGTFQTMDIRQTGISNLRSYISQFFFNNDKVYFTANNGVNGFNYYVKSFCEIAKNLKTVDIRNGAHLAQNSITATSKISMNRVAIFDAGNSIELNPGFETDLGAIFKTKLNGCITD